MAFCQENLLMLLHDKRVAENANATKLLLETLQVKGALLFQRHRHVHLAEISATCH